MHPQALHPAPGLLASPQLPVQMQAAGKVRLVTVSRNPHTTKERLLTPTAIVPPPVLRGK